MYQYDGDQISRMSMLISISAWNFLILKTLVTVEKTYIISTFLRHLALETLDNVVFLGSRDARMLAGGVAGQ